MTSAAARPLFLDPTFPEQSAVVADPSRRIVVLCSRRSGKTNAAVRKLYQTCYDVPYCNTLFIGLTRESTKRMVWKDVLKPTARELRLPVKFHETDLTATLTSNGSVIYVLGMDADEEEKNKIFGQKFKGVVIDEGALYSIDIKDMINVVLRPALMDQQGWLMLMGMPANTKHSYLYELTKEQDSSQPGRWTIGDPMRGGWSGHRWGALQNPYVREVYEREIEDMKVETPGIEEQPWFQQQYLGRWVIDEKGRVYHFQNGLNTFDGTLPTFREPRGSWHYVLGIDLGFNDETAFVVAAYHDLDPTLYFLEADKEAGLDFTAVAERVKQYQKRYDFDSLVIDGANKQGVEELRKRHGLPLENADKQGKLEHIKTMNADFAHGHIRLNARKCALLVDEYEGLAWDRRALEKGKYVEPARAPNHLCDAALYAHTHCYQYLSETPKPQLPLHSREHAEAEAQALLEADEEAFLRQQQEEREQERYFGDYQ